MGTVWMALHPPGCDGWMALSMCFHGSLLLEWEGPEKDGSCVYQQKQNVISIGKYFKVSQPFKMKQNRSLQNVHSSHCSSWACLFQGKQISLAVAHADSSSSSALPCPHSEFGEACDPKPSHCFDSSFSKQKVSSTFCRTDIAVFHPALGAARVLLLERRPGCGQSCQYQGMAKPPP